MNFSPKRSAERDVFTVDFGPILAPGETIVTAEWSITVARRNDPHPEAMIEGDCTITGTKVSQVIVSGVPGTTYAPFCAAQTSAGRQLILPDPGFGLLFVPS
jgi:hypothetical protein